MSSLTVYTAAEQVAAHLRKELSRGMWSGLMPGSNRLAKELGVGGNTLEAALILLEKEGLLVPQGPGRRRKIQLSKNIAPPVLRVAILRYDREQRNTNYMVDLVHELEAAGHSASFSSEGLLELGMDARRIARMVKRTEADAWILSSASREVLQWFAAQDTPAFALFGRRDRVPMAAAGPNKLPAFVSAARELHRLGHRRIVLLTSRMRRMPVPGPPEQAFLDELQALGQTVSAFNVPDWEETQESFHQCLDSLFQHTPPTALLIDEPPYFIATQHFLARRGILAPEHVSLICLDVDPAFAWCEPAIAHIRWSSRPLVRRIARWADNVASGKDDRRQTSTKAELVIGGTIGPVPTEHHLG